MSRVRSEAGLALGGGQEHYLRYLGLPTMLGVTTQTLSANRIYFLPIHVPYMVTITHIGYVDQANNTTKNFRLALYEDGGDQPDTGSLLCETNSFPGTNAVKNERPAGTVQLKPRLIWAAFNSDVNPGVVVNQINLGTNGGLATLYPRYVDQAFGAMPDPAPATAATTQAPVMFCRVVSIP